MRGFGSAMTGMPHVAISPPAIVQRQGAQWMYEGNIPAAVTYTVTSQRSGEVRTFGQRPIAEKYFDQEVARSQGRERI